MDTLLKTVSLAIPLSIALVTSGCQSNLPVRQDAQVVHQDFGASWSAYKACKGSQELPIALQESDILQSAVAPAAVQTNNGIKARLSALFTANRPRYAADPLQMSMDCLLHAGKLAESKDEYTLAHSLYQQVLRTPHSQNTAYFQQVAQASLDRLVEQAHSPTALLLSSK